MCNFDIVLLELCIFYEVLFVKYNCVADLKVMSSKRSSFSTDTLVKLLVLFVVFLLLELFCC